MRGVRRISLNLGHSQRFRPPVVIPKTTPESRVTCTAGSGSEQQQRWVAAAPEESITTPVLVAPAMLPMSERGRIDKV